MVLKEYFRKLSFCFAVGLRRGKRNKMKSERHRNVNSEKNNHPFIYMGVSMTLVKILGTFKKIKIPW